MKLGMKLLEMGRDMKIKHSVSSPICKVWENFFRKKALHRETNGFGQTYWGNILHGEQLPDHAREKLMVKRFQRPITLVFLSLTLT